jgi:hypothetical protein
MTPLEGFGLWCLQQMRDPSPGDIDGGSAQDEAERLGLLIRTEVHGPCGELCNCAEWGEFPQDCLRINTHLMPPRWEQSAEEE